ncbi:MAG: hypothetical protein ACI4C3_11020 [Bacteroides sp.]
MTEVYVNVRVSVTIVTNVTAKIGVYIQPYIKNRDAKKNCNDCNVCNAHKKPATGNKFPASPEGREAERGNEGVKKQKPV